MPEDVIVCGAGIVGVSVALQLQRRGHQVVLVDRQGPGEGTSFGNAGLIQREAVFPHGFPRDLATLARIAGNRATDVAFHGLALPGLASPLLRYWRHSHPRRYAQAVAGHAQLILTCIEEHQALAAAADASALLRPIGYLKLFGDPGALARGAAEAERARAEFGVNSVLLDADGLAAAEPSLAQRKAGAIHWTDPLSLDEPYALTMAYVRLFEQLGGRVVRGDAMSLAARAGGGWSVRTEDGPLEAPLAVVALGAASPELTRRFGYAPPVFGKRGYHRHFRLAGNAVLNRPMLDADSGFMLIPMRAGVRLTTGAEFARTDAPPTPVQLARAEPVARGLLPLGEAVEAQPWMGVRPATPDMVPVIGPAPGQPGLWYCFGHAHQGLTLGPSSGRLLAEMIGGEAPFLDPAPYRAERFG